VHLQSGKTKKKTKTKLKQKVLFYISKGQAKNEPCQFSLVQLSYVDVYTSLASRYMCAVHGVTNEDDVPLFNIPLLI